MYWIEASGLTKIYSLLLFTFLYVQGGIRRRFWNSPNLNYFGGGTPSWPRELKSPVLQEMLGISKFEKPR